MILADITVDVEDLYGLKLALLEAARLIDDETDPNVIVIGAPTKVDNSRYRLDVRVREL